MKTMQMGKSSLQVPAIAIGCMRMDGLDTAAAASYVDRCLELGANFFDHADIYGGGKSEEIFAEAVGMTPARREKILLQSKCGIVPGRMYDSSAAHIESAVDGILKRLRTDYLDSLLIHRPDALMDPEEIAAVFEKLEKAGKVKCFGVSNFKPMQIALLQKHMKQELNVNQLQFSITNSNMVRNGMEVNMETEGSLDHDGSVLDYCRLHSITIQAWSPFQFGFFEGVFLDNPRFAKLNGVIDEIASKYGVSGTSIAAAWILRHPAGIQMIAGTMNEKRLEEICAASAICLEREEWYRIYLAAGHILP